MPFLAVLWNSSWQTPLEECRSSPHCKLMCHELCCCRYPQWVLPRYPALYRWCHLLPMVWSHMKRQRFKSTNFPSPSRWTLGEKTHLLEAIFGNVTTNGTCCFNFSMVICVKEGLSHPWRIVWILHHCNRATMNHQETLFICAWKCCNFDSSLFGRKHSLHMHKAIQWTTL